MARKDILKDRITGEEIYPVTHSDCIITSDRSDVATEKTVDLKIANTLESSPEIVNAVADLKNRLNDDEDVAISVEKQIAEAKMKLFIDRWNVLFDRFGKYNEETGYFEGNGLLDITYNQALNIIERTLIDTFSNNGRFSLNATGDSSVQTYRTNLPLQVFPNSTDMESKGICSGNHQIEVLNLFPAKQNFYSNNFRVNAAGDFVRSCSRLKKIMGIISIWNLNSTLGSGFMAALPNLEEVSLNGLRAEHNLDLSGSPKLNFDSVSYLVRACNTSSVTVKNTAKVKVHAGIYAAMTGEAEAYPFNGGTQEEWEQLLVDSTAKGIIFTT